MTKQDQLRKVLVFGSRAKYKEICDSNSGPKVRGALDGGGGHGGGGSGGDASHRGDWHRRGWVLPVSHRVAAAICAGQGGLKAA